MSMLNCGGGGGEGVCVNMPKKKHRNLILHRLCLMGMLACSFFLLVLFV